MSRAAVNANVTHFPDAEAVEGFKEALRGEVRKRCGSVFAFSEVYGMTTPAVYERIHDPDKWTLGQLREARHVLGMDKEQFLQMVGTLI